MVVDFRLRPPFGGFLQAAIYTQRERSATMGAAMGFYPPQGASSQRVEDTFREMDEGGVHIGVIPVKCGNPGFFGDVTNDEVAAFVGKHPDRFVGFAGPNLGDPKAGLEDIERWASRPEFRGFVFEPGLWPKALYADDRSYYPLYERCQSLGVPALFMAGGNAGPDVDHTAPGIIDRVCRDFPKLTVIAGHGGWPWVHQVLHCRISASESVPVSRHVRLRDGGMARLRRCWERLSPGSLHLRDSLPDRAARAGGHAL